jgi:glycosyltransferase involved in cell wall biosynthesis
VKSNLNISIVTINLNNLNGLKKTANSIPNIDGIEWIVIDGISTDGSLEFLSTLDRKPNILISEKDSGIYDAMNKGIQLASGEYVNFMNAGDFFEDNFFKNCKNEFERSSDIIYGNTLLSDGQLLKNPTNLDFFYIFNKMINHQSLFIKRNLLLKYPFNLKYKIVADWVQLFNILKHENPSLKYLNQTVCKYDTTGFSSRLDSERKNEKNVFLRSIYSDWELKDLNKLSKIRIRNWFQLIDRAIDSKRIGNLFSLLNRLIFKCRI